MMRPDTIDHVNVLKIGELGVSEHDIAKVNVEKKLYYEVRGFGDFVKFICDFKLNNHIMFVNSRD